MGEEVQFDVTTILPHQNERLLNLDLLASKRVTGEILAKGLGTFILLPETPTNIIK